MTTISMSGMRALLVLGGALAIQGVMAQPPVGPDPSPQFITTEEFSKAMGGPLLVTLNFKDARPEQVYGAIAQQAGMMFDPSSSEDLWKTLPPVTVNIKNQPFLMALRNLTARDGLHFTFRHSSVSVVGLQLSKNDDPQMQMDGPVFESKAFLVIASSVQRKRTVGLQPDRPVHPLLSHEEVFFNFVILGDPKLLPIYSVGAPRFLEQSGWKISSAAEDEPWRSMKQQSGDSLREWRFTAHRELTKTSGKPVLNFESTAGTLLVTTKSEVWDAPVGAEGENLSKDVTLAEGQRRYAMQVGPNVRQYFNGSAQEYTVRLQISGVGITKGQWSGWPDVSDDNILESFHLVDAQGVDFAIHSSWIKDGVVNATFWNAGPRGPGEHAVGKAAKVLWTIPTEIREIAIPVEFSNLPVQ